MLIVLLLKGRWRISTKCCREDKEIELQSQTLVTEAFDNGRENLYCGIIWSIINLYNKRVRPTKKEPQQGFLYLTIKMSSSKKFKSNAKTSTSTGILFLFYYFLIKSYPKELLRMQGSYKRFKKLKASKESTQLVTTNPDF